MSTSQTLSRGLQALEYIATTTDPPSIEDLAARLEVHRSVAYRIIRTLEAHDFTARDDDGCCVPTPRLAVLGGLRDDLSRLAASQLQELADTVECTAFLVIRDGDEAKTIASREPAGSAVNVSYRPGTRHPIGRGAPGLALLAGDSAVSDERDTVSEARIRGWAESTSEVIPGMSSVAAPVAGTPLAVAVIHLAADGRDHHRIAPHIVEAAATLEAVLTIGRSQNSPAS